MRKIMFSLLVIITAVFTIQIINADENFYLLNTTVKSKDIHIEIDELKESKLEEEVIKRLGSRDISDVKEITITKGSLSNNDFKFLSEELLNLKSIDLSKLAFNEPNILITFSDNNKIENFEFPTSKNGYKIADNFFKNNRNLKAVELNGVNSLGKFVFENTENLKNIDLSMVDFFDEGIFINSGIENVTFKQGYDLSKHFFKDTKSLVTIDISDAKTIGEGAFINSGIEFVKMPNSYALEGYTFSETKNLVKVDLSGATRLGTGDFLSSNVEEVIFPNNFSLPDFYFAKTLNLKNIDISNARDIGAGIFAFSNIETVKFPKEFLVSDGMFQYTENMSIVDVSNASEFKEAAFAGSSVSKIIMPQNFEVSNAMFGFMPNLISIDLSGTEFLGSNIFVKQGNNYDFYRKLFEGGDLVSNIEGGVETVVFGGSIVPSVSANTFANLGNYPPVILLPKATEWDGFSNTIVSKNNEVKNQLRYEAFTYNDLMISKNTLIQIGFVNPVAYNEEKEVVDVKYQWYFNGDEIVNGNQSTFTIDNFTINDEGSYRLDITVDGNIYSLYDINLKANELAVDEASLYKGYFLNEEIDEQKVNVIYVKDEIRQPISFEDLDYAYDFSEIGNTSIKITYTKDDLVVVADYPVKVANTLPPKIKIKKGKSFTYNPKIDGFEFVSTSNQNDFFEIENNEENSEITIIAKDRYNGELDFKFNGRVGQVEIEIVRNLFWLWIGLGATLILALALIIYLRLTRGMFKIKRRKN